jgi:hypothetical protein
MTVAASQVNRVSYAGNGTTTAFSYPSKFLANGDLVVVLVDDDDGTETTKTITTHYTVTGAGDANGGTVTMVTAPAVGETLVIYGDPTISQLVDPVNGDDLNVNSSIEDPLDKLTIIARRLKDIGTRSVRLTDGDASGATTTLSTEGNSGKYVRLNSGGTAFEFATGSVSTSTFTQSGTGGVERTVTSKLSELGVSSEDYGGANGSDESADIGQAITYRTTNGGEVQITPRTHLLASVLTLPSLVHIVGQGMASILKIADNADAPAIRTTGYSTFTSQNKWFVDTESVPYGFGLRNLIINGNKANQASGNAVEIYGKNITLLDVTIYDAQDIGLVMECGYKGGQNDYRDMPEGRIAGVKVTGSGSHNIRIRGPHDQVIESLVSGSAGGDGLRIEGLLNTYLGTCDLRFYHGYAATLIGLYCDIKFKGGHIEVESCTREGLYIDTAASATTIDKLEAFSNSVGSSSYYQAKIVGAESVIASYDIRLTSTGAGAGGMQVTGASVKLGPGNIKDGNATASAIGLDLDANKIQALGGESLNFTGSGAIGLRTGNTGSTSGLVVRHKCDNCYTGWKNTNAGNGGQYEIEITTENKDHLLFEGAGPAVVDLSGGAGTSARERWNVFATNSGAAHSGTAQAGAAGTITLASTASTRNDVYNGAIINLTGGTGSGQKAVITDYVGSTRVATIACLNSEASADWATNPDNTTTYTVSSLVLRSHNSGTFTVPNGKTQVRVPHGLLPTDLSITKRNVSITPTLFSNAAEMTLTEVTNFYFVATVDADPGAGTATGSFNAGLDW